MEFARSLLLLGLFVALPEARAVVGGSVVTDSLLLASIVWIQGDDGHCTGVVIGWSTVLTAGHCTQSSHGGNKPFMPRMIRSSQAPAFDPTAGEWISVETTAAKFDLMPTLEGIYADLGVLFLTSPLPANARPLKVAKGYAPNDEFCLVGTGVDAAVTVDGVTTFRDSADSLKGLVKMRCRHVFIEKRMDEHGHFTTIADAENRIFGSGRGDSGGAVLKINRDGSFELVGIIHGGSLMVGGTDPLADTFHRTTFVDLTEQDNLKWVRRKLCTGINLDPVDPACATF